MILVIFLISGDVLEIKEKLNKGVISLLQIVTIDIINNC